MKTLSPLSLSSCKIEILEENKQEIIHEDVHEDEDDNSDDSDDEEDLDAVFGHKNAIRQKASAGSSTNHTKNKPSVGELKVNVEGPIRLTGNIAHQRAPHSATQPTLKGVGFGPKPVPQTNFAPLNHLYPQGYAPLQPQYNQGHPGGVPSNPISSINHQLYQQNQLFQYHMHPMYAAQPQSAGLSRKPPGFEFMQPKPVPFVPAEPVYKPQYPEYSNYVQPQTPYFSKQSTWGEFAPNHEYDIAHYKKQPQSATMLPSGPISLESKAKTVAKQPQADTQESAIFEQIKQCESITGFEERMEFLKGKLCGMLFTQTGSRFVQKQLGDEGTEVEYSQDMREQQQKKRELSRQFTSFILEEIGDKVNELMIDRYGNYFFQELIRRCDSEQRLKILQSIKEDFIQICTDKKGTHTVQRLIDMVDTQEEEKALLDCVQGQVVKLCMDAQGTHVMQKYVKVRV